MAVDKLTQLKMEVYSDATGRQLYGRPLQFTPNTTVAYMTIRMILSNK